MSSAPTTVYRFFDAQDQLLYVGITLSVTARLEAHRHDKPWWREAVWVELMHFDDRRTAEVEELRAIANEDPLWNRAERNAAGPARPTQGLLFSARLAALRRRPTEDERLRRNAETYGAVLEMVLEEERERALNDPGFDDDDRVALDELARHAADRQASMGGGGLL